MGLAEDSKQTLEEEQSEAQATVQATVADLGFLEGGFVWSGALARSREIFANHAHFRSNTTPFYVVEQYPRC